MTKERITEVLEDMQSEVNALHKTLAVGQKKGDEPHDSIEDAYKAIQEAVDALGAIE